MPDYKLVNVEHKNTAQIKNTFHKRMYFGPKFVSSLIALLGVVWLGMLCAPTAMATSKTIGTLKIGVVLPLSGKIASYGREIKDGIDLSVRRYLNDPEREGHVEVIIKDSGGSTQRSEELAEMLLKEHRVTVLIGGLSNPESSALAKLSHTYGKIYFSLLAKEIDDFDKYPASFMSNSHPDFQAQVAAEYMSKFITQGTTAVVMNEKAAKQEKSMLASFKDQFKENLKKTPLNLTLKSPPVSTNEIPIDATDKTPENSPATSQSESPESRKPNTPDALSNKTLGGSEVSDSDLEQDLPYIDPLEVYRDLAAEVMEKKISNIFIGLNWSQSYLAIQALQDAEFTGRVVGIEYWESRASYDFFKFLKNIKAFHVSHYRSDMLPLDFISSFKTLYKRVPSALAGIAYDSSQVILGAYKAARSDRIPPLLSSIKQTHQVEGVLSGLKIGSHRAIERAMTVSSPGPSGNTAVLITMKELELVTAANSKNKEAKK